MELVVDKNVGVKNVKHFYSDLNEAIGKSETVVINFSDVDRIDLSIMTVLNAAFRHVKRNGKMIKLKNVSKNLKEQLYIAGFSM